MTDIFDQETTFETMGLSGGALRGVQEAGFEHPTHIQAQLIPAVLSGKDVIGQAKTGTGKTAAFGLPLLQLADPEVSMQGLILVPTRELAVQVTNELMQLGRHTKIRSTCIIGGESMRLQKESIKKGGHLMVGTPGRVMDLIGRREINLNHIRFLVLDEVDRMLDVGFRQDIDKIFKAVKTKHQTVFVSATVSGEIERLAKRYLKRDMQKIVTTSGSLTVSQVDQSYIPVQHWDKRKLLLYVMRHEEPDTTVVFCRTKATVRRVTEFLRKKEINAREIHGDITQAMRNRVMKSMRAGHLDVLVASDLAARGLDIEHISHVINYDLPEDPEVYVHRIGRTARAGRQGVAWSFVCPDQGQLLTAIEKLVGLMIERLEYDGFKPGPVPEDRRAEVKQQQPASKAKSHGEVLRDRAEVAAHGGMDKQALAAMFPGGVLPQGAPKRTLGGKFRRRKR